MNARTTFMRRVPCWLLGLICLVSGIAMAKVATPTLAPLRDRFAAVRQQTPDNPFREPVYLSSKESGDRLQGEVHALVEQPFGQLSQALAPVEAWCSVLILHLNVKYCRLSNGGPAPVLDVGIGRKFDQPLADAHWARFEFRSVKLSSNRLSIELQAPAGPMGTYDYRIAFEAEPFDATRSVIRLGYSYGHGTAARLATQAYLATLARDKVGFSVIGRRADGQPQYVSGIRGVVERNTMRYYLAIDAYLGAQRLPPPARLRQSLDDWFAATERYPRQLHEIDRDVYIEMKLNEAQRQQTLVVPPRK